MEEEAPVFAFSEIDLIENLYSTYYSTLTMAAVPSSSMIDTSIFEQLQLKIDEDVQVRENIRNAVQALEKQGTTLQDLAKNIR
jgi:hypothetical protein